VCVTGKCSKGLAYKATPTGLCGTFWGGGGGKRLLFALIRCLAEVRDGRKYSVRHTHSTFYVVRAASAKCGLHVHNMKFNTQNEDRIIIHIIISTILPVYLSIHHVQ
jgi:hypothetical protein